MKTNLKKLLALVLALAMVAALFVGCQDSKKPDESKNAADTTGTKADTQAPDVSNDTDAPETTEAPEPGPAEYVPTGAQLVAGKEYGKNKDYISLYDKYGKDISIADVEEDPATGLAYLNVDGQQFELGLDFLTMAMVYNTSTEGTSFASEDEVYAEWWKYYITRWNSLLPEIPLYSNEYYDVYNAAIKGVDEHPTNPFWSVSKALIDWSSEKADNSFIMGSSTDLSGKFRYSTFGASSPGSSDNDVDGLVNGLETVVANKEGNYQWNDTVVAAHEETDNEDGSHTYIITINDDMKFSDGSPVTAKNYLYFPMAFSTPVATEAASKDHKSMMNYAGYDNFAAYDGTNDGEAIDDEITASKVMTGVRLLGDYQFSVTVDKNFYPYFYAIAYASLSPSHQSTWACNCDIVDDGEGCYWTDEFYAKDGDSYTNAKHISDVAANTDTTYPYSGAYVVESYDTGAKEATLKLNPYFKGNYEGIKPSIETIVYKKIVTETQLDDLTSGGVDCLAAITGGAATNEAISMADASNGKFVYTHYSRAGYGKLGFRADYGPVQFVEVRRAIAYCMDRATFAKDFTGGYGGVVDGPYYTGSWMYKAATAQGMLLDAYDTSVDSAIEVLEAGGWIYDAEGNPYTEGVRYKMIPAEYATENDINYKSKDGKYVTTKVGDNYYMPLVLNWFGTVDNEFSDLLVTGFEKNDNVANAGMVVYETLGDFAPMLDELAQAQLYGYYSGTPMYCVFNFATGFNSATYDYSFNMTIDPGMYDDYSAYYIKDAADIYFNN